MGDVKIIINVDIRNRAEILGREKIDSKTIRLNSSNASLPSNLNAWLKICRDGDLTRYRVNLSDTLIGCWIVPKKGERILVLDATHPSLARFYPYIQNENEGLPVKRVYVPDWTMGFNYTEWYLPLGMYDSNIDWDFDKKTPATVTKRKCIWWRDQASLMEMKRDVELREQRNSEFIKARIKRKQAADPCNSCCQCFIATSDSCDKCCSAPCVACNDYIQCKNCQHNAFFKWHNMPCTVWREDIAGRATPSEESCHYSLACCCVPLWPVLPFIGCFCVGAPTSNPKPEIML